MRAKRQTGDRPANFPALTFPLRGTGWRGGLSTASSLSDPLAPTTVPHRWDQDARPRPSTRHPAPPGHVPRPHPAGARASAARRGGASAPAYSQPQSQPAPRGPTRANPVTHLRRANSSLALPSHTLTPGSRWRRQRQRQGTLTPGVRRSSGGRTRASTSRH